jgi:ATP-dependent DNA helicase RecG
VNTPWPERIAAGESQTLEFKTSFDKAAIESLVAFANAGRIQGVTLGKETLNEWLVQIKSATSPSIIPELDAHHLDGKTLVMITVSEFPVKPVSTKGRYYKRVANTNQALNASLEDLSMAKVNQFVQQVNAGGRFALGTTDGLTALQKLNYTSQGHPTWAAMLLFAQEPLRHHIHIGRFKTPSLIIDDRQITDTLFEAVDQAMRFIVSYVPVAFEITGAIHRTERFAYPLPALREALLNAVVHREYKDGSDIQVKIFDDKITIFSPGSFYGGLSVTEVQADGYRSSLRNKLVAEAFYLTTAIEKYGSGFIRIRKALLDYPEIQVATTQRPTTHRIPRRPQNRWLPRHAPALKLHPMPTEKSYGLTRAASGRPSFVRPFNRGAP